MFKGIYNVYAVDLQYSVLKVIPNLGKNQVQPSYLNLNYGGFRENFSNNPRNIDWEGVTIWKFLAADVERIESVCAVCAVFEEVFFRFGKFFAAFVFSETVAAAAHGGCLNGED